MATVFPSYASKLYYRSGGVAASGSDVEIDLVKDCTVTLEYDEAETTTRGDGGFKTFEPTLCGITIEGEMEYDTDDSAFQVLESAFQNRTLIGIVALDGSINDSGKKGVKADMKFSKFDIQKSLNDTLKVSFTLKPCRSDTNPSFYTVP